VSPSTSTTSARPPIRSVESDELPGLAAPSAAAARLARVGVVFRERAGLDFVVTAFRV
jgi:hypothetical protein